jgi:hypothetical protein
LVCVSNSCEACSESGARACAAGLTCSPNGSCVDTDDFEPGGDGGDGTPGESKVQGGALTCSAGAGGTGALSTLLALLGGAVVLGRRRAGREPKAGE